MSNIKTSAYNDFIKRLNEIEILKKHAVSLGPTSIRLDSIANEKNSICKGTILLLCGDIEAYYMGLGELTLEKFQSSMLQFNELPRNLAYHLLKDKITPIIQHHNSGDFDQLIDCVTDVTSTVGKNWENFRKVEFEIKSENLKGGISIPNTKTVEKYFRRFGYENFRVDFFKKHKENSTSIRNNYDSVIKIRNDIAHGVKYSVHLSDLYGERTDVITPEMVEEMVNYVKTFCESVDTLFANWCEQNLFSIR